MYTDSILSTEPVEYRSSNLLTQYFYLRSAVDIYFVSSQQCIILADPAACR